jgi:hypothetical protein
MLDTFVHRHVGIEPLSALPNHEEADAISNTFFVQVG